MINYDKLEKVGEYKDGSLTWFTDKEENVVYLIRIGDESYIGSTKNLRRRFSQYITDLSNNTYCSPTMQEQFNKTREFTIFIIERVIDNNLREQEQFHIDTLQPSLNTKTTAYNGKDIPNPKRRENTELEKIRILCKQAGITQKELAERIGLSAVGLSKAINGNPTKDTLEKIASALNVRITELFEEPTNINGYIELGGTIHKVTSKEDIKKLAEKL